MCSSRIRGEIVFQKLAREKRFRALNPEKKRPKKISDGTDPPPQKKAFFGGGSVSSDIFFNFGDTTLLQNMKNIKSKFLIDL